MLKKNILAVLLTVLFSSGILQAENIFRILDTSSGTMQLQSAFAALLEKNDHSFPEELAVEIVPQKLPIPEKLSTNEVIADDGFMEFDRQRFSSLTYAFLPVVIAVHSQCPIDDIQLSDLQRIYVGKTGLWSRLAGQGSGKIKIAGMMLDSAVGRAFRRLVMQQDIFRNTPTDVIGDIVPDILQLDSGKTAALLLESVRELIVFGDWSLAVLKNRKYKLLKINGVAPDYQSITSGKYPLVVRYSLLYDPANKPLQLSGIAGLLGERLAAAGECVMLDSKK